MSPKRHDWHMNFFHNFFSIFYYIYFEGLSMKFISPSIKKVVINWIFFSISWWCHQKEGGVGRGGDDYVMALPNRFYVDSPSFAKYFQGTKMRLQQVFVLNRRSFYLKNFTVQKQGLEGISLLITFHRNN